MKCFLHKAYLLLWPLALFVLGLAFVSPVAAQVAAVPQTMNFQGRLARPDGTPVPNGTYSIRFSLWNVVSGGTPAANEKWNKTAASVTVKNGVFAVTLDAFPANLFNGNLWLEIKIGADAALTPRQPLVTVPYAFKADLARTVPDGSITNVNIAVGTLTADRFAANTFNPLAWLLNGNGGVTSGFLGTTDTNPLEFRVNNRRAMRYQYVENTAIAGSEYRGINTLGGSEINSIDVDVVGGTIAGGGWDFALGTDYPNRVLANFGTVGGGYRNYAGEGAVVAGGGFNTALSFAATIAGGYGNTANAIATVVGGESNTASGEGACIGGGAANTASGNYSTIPGGYFNQATGIYSFAGGNRARANHTGTFVWADNQNAEFASTAVNQFSVRAYGGMVFEANGSMPLYTSATSGEKNRYLFLLNSPQTSTASGLKAGGILCADSYGYANPGKNDMVVKGTLGVGYTGTAPYVAAFNGNVYANGSFLSSDARYKTKIAPLDNALDSVLSLRGVSYEWDKAKFPNQNFGDGKQMGFIAQEIEKIFPELVMTAPDGYKAVNYVGIVPVLVEAVKTLHARTVLQQKQLEARDKKIAEMEAKLDALVITVRQLQNNPK